LRYNHAFGRDFFGTLVKYIHFVIAALFFYIAALQLNDPDPLYWVAMYSGTAMIAVSKGFGRFSEFWAAVAIGAALAGLMVAAPAVVEFVSAGDFSAIGDMESANYVEPTREFGGLLIALVLLVYYLKH